MESEFKPKVGQLVSWRTGSPSTFFLKEHLGLITKIFANNTVEVTFVKNDWVIILSPENLKLINDVESK